MLKNMVGQSTASAINREQPKRPVAWPLTKARMPDTHPSTKALYQSATEAPMETMRSAREQRAIPEELILKEPKA